MKIVVTGGSGFLGATLIRGLSLVNEVWSLDIEDWRVTGIPTIKADIATFTDFFDCDFIIHAASPVGPVGILKNTGELGRGIINGTHQVIRWALAFNAKVIFISSSEVYGHDGVTPETAACVFAGPASVRREYAQAKLLSETMIHNAAYDRPDFRYQIIRPFNIIGPGQLPEKGFVVPRFVIQALSDKPLTVYGDGRQRRAFIHALDVCEAVMTITRLGGHNGHVWNVGNPHNETTILELAELVRRKVGKGSIIHVDPKSLHGPKFAEAPDKIPDIRRIEEIGWCPEIGLEGAVEGIIECWREDKRYLAYANLV